MAIIKKNLGKTVVYIKRVAILALGLAICVFLFKMQMLRQKCNALASMISHMIEFRLTTTEEKLDTLASFINDSSKRYKAKNTRQSIASQNIRNLLLTSPYVEEVAWVAGDGRQNMCYARTEKGIVKKTMNGNFKSSPLFDAHQRGQMTISKIEYNSTTKKIPTFHLSYPLNSRDGGLILAKVNLWDFLKSPLLELNGLLNGSINFEVRDKQKKLIAHKISKEEKAMFINSFISGKAQSERLGLDVKLTMTNDSFKESLLPKNLLWGIAGGSVFLALLM
ncbi:PDC sensor domain-containing protein [Elusimicrobiota bacterium]